VEYGSTWFGGALARHPDAVALSDRSGSASGGELLERAGSVACALGDRKLQVVGLDLEPGIDWVVALFGTWGAGAIAMPIDPRLDGDTREARLGRCDEVLDSVPDGGGKPAPGAPPGPPDPALLLHTSGSTGAPQEVLLSHANLIAQATGARDALEGSRADRWLSTLPLSHMGGLGVVARCAAWGCEAIIRERFDAGEVARLLSDREEGVTVVSLVPTMLRRLLDEGLRHPPTLRRAIVSGAPLPIGLKQEAIGAGVPLVESWGMTETTAMATVERRPGQGGAGQPLPGVHVEISEEGGIRVGGPTVAPGMTVGGMLETGDAGTIDDGVLTVHGRAGSRIITGGEKVVPERVEAVLASVPGVEQCVVFGEPDPEWGEVVVARVVASRDPGRDGDALERACREGLAPWEVPKRIEFVGAIEVTASGKPVREGQSGVEGER